MFKRILLASILLGCLSLSGGGAQSSSVMLQAMSFVGLLVSLIVGFIFIKLIMKSMGCLPTFLIFCAIVVFVMYAFGMLNNGIQGIPDAVQVFLGQKKQAEQVDDPMAQLMLQAQTNISPQVNTQISQQQVQSQAQSQSVGKLSTPQQANEQKVSISENFSDSDIVAPSLGLEEEKISAPVVVETPVQPVQQQQQKVEQGPINLLENLPAVYGATRVLSSDTLYINGYQIRLYGIDGPEPSQTCTDQKGRSYNCGQEASMWLKDWLSSHEVECRIMNKESNGRLVGVCFLGKYDIAAALVNAGLAFANSREAEIYEPYEMQAKQERRGLWRGTFYKPWDWRKVQSRKPKIKIIQKKKRKGLLDI